MHCSLAAISTNLTLTVMIVTSASGAAPLFNRRIPVESIVGNQPDDGLVGHCLQTTEGWKQITGYVFPGDGIRHTVRGKCLEDGSVLILEDDLPECGTEQQCAQIAPSR